MVLASTANRIYPPTHETPVTGMPRVLTCHKITKAHRGESDHHKVNGLQGCPPLNVFENDGRDGHKHNTAGQDKQDGGDDPDLGLTHLLFLGMAKKKDRQVSFISNLDSEDTLHAEKMHYVSDF